MPKNQKQKETKMEKVKIDLGSTPKQSEEPVQPKGDNPKYANKQGKKPRKFQDIPKDAMIVGRNEVLDYVLPATRILSKFKRVQLLSRGRNNVKLDRIYEQLCLRYGEHKISEMTHRSMCKRSKGSDIFEDVEQTMIIELIPEPQKKEEVKTNAVEKPKEEIANTTPQVAEVKPAATENGGSSKVSSDNTIETNQNEKVGKGS